MVSLGNQTHKRPTRLWPASLPGQGKGELSEQQELTKNKGFWERSKEKSNSMSNAAYCHESDCNLSLFMCSVSDSSPKDGLREKQGAFMILEHIEPNHPVALPELLFCLPQIGGYL